jgi:hypothetical protein
MPSLYEQILSNHRRTLDRLVERGAVERLRSVYMKASAEVLAKLERLGTGSATFTAHQLRMVLAQLKAGQIYMSGQLLDELTAASREAQLESLHALIRDYKLLEKHFTGHEPVLPIEEAARFAGVIDKSRTSLLRQHKASMKSYGSQMVERFEGEMAVSLATGETLDGAIDRVHGVMKSDFWRAERVARTECAWSANATHVDGIKEIAKEDAGVFQQWVEFCAPDGKPLDNRVSCDSIAIHGELAPPGGEFTMPAEAPYPDAKGETKVRESLVGQSWKVPPCRPNGRETVEVWKQEWGSPGWLYEGGKRKWLVRP